MARDREAERLRLQAMLDAATGRPPTHENEQIAKYTDELITETWGGHSVDARRKQRLGLLLADMLKGSGISDAEPASMTDLRIDGGLRFSVMSRSRGRVPIGTVAQWALNDLYEVPPLDRAQAAAIAGESLTARTARRVRRTAELDAAEPGITAREIGKRIATEEGCEPFTIRTVRDWRRAAKNPNR
jgi:hypothetical protein